MGISLTGGIEFGGKFVVVNGEPAEVSITPSSITQDEGDAGITTYTYTVSRVANPLLDNTNLVGIVGYEVTGSGADPATAGDFVGGVFPSGEITFNKGDGSTTLDIQVQGDITVEPTRQFTITLTPVNNVIISPTNGSAIGIITNDDVEEFSITLSSNENNYNLRNEVDLLGYSGGTTPAIVTVTINSGVTIGSTSTSTFAFDTGSFPSGSIINLINNGRIQGKGGNGGSGLSGNGGSGGDALQLLVATNITNNNDIWAGGGGGGGGDPETSNQSGTVYFAGGGGGGGGAGTNAGSGGNGGDNVSADIIDEGTDGNNGTATSGGSGGDGGSTTFSTGTDGGNGGGPGQNGGNGLSGGGNGGSAGDYIVGNSFATWLVTGDVRGGVTA